MKLWQMMVNTLFCIPSKNKNFIMHTPWDRNFLLSQNTNFSTKKFLPPFHIQLKFFCLWHMIAHSYPYHLSRNKNFTMQWSRVKNFLLTQNIKFSTKKFLPPFHCQLKFFLFVAYDSPYVPLTSLQESKFYLAHTLR